VSKVDHLGEALAAWTDARGLVIDEAENIPADRYSFRPTPEVRSVAELFIHILEVSEMMVGELCRPDGDFRRTSFEELIHELKEAYKDFTGNVKLFDFFQEMQYAYSAADLVVTRAGATTISELILFRLPAVIIPYPYAYQHQSANARILEKSHSAVIIQDSLLGAGILKDALQRLVNDRVRLTNMRLGYESLFRPQAADRLLEYALALN